jgi:malate dehydrogenase (oxaloacetate-decarboxylating)(NADP+)
LGPNYIIPKPFDSRLFVEVSTAVAEAAVASGVARDASSIGAVRQLLKARNASRHAS